MNILLGFLFWGICISLHKYLSVITYKNGMDINLHKQKPLFDIIQNNFPNLQHLRIIPEILHIIPVATLVFLILYNFNEFSLQALNTFFTKHGTLMFLRGLFFSSTLLPDSSQMCSVSTHIGSCFDLIFSGHSTIMYLSTYIINTYFSINTNIYYLFHFNNLITSILIILCRNHYTVDVLISIVLTYLII